MTEYPRRELRSRGLRPFFDVVDRAVEQPLDVHLRLASQKEMIHSPIVSYFFEYWLDDMHPLAVDLLRFGQVDPAHHLLLERVLDFSNFYMKASHLANLAQKAAFLQRAIYAVAFPRGVPAL